MDGARRYIEVLAFVALWMALGWTFHLDTNSYLLIGVSVGRALPAVRSSAATAAALGSRCGGFSTWPRWKCNRRASYPRAWIRLNFRRIPEKSWIVVLWFLCAVAGAVFAAFAITQQRASAARPALPSFISAVLIGMAIMAASALASHHDIGVPLSKLSLLLKQFLLYFTVTFVLEEVAFRGASGFAHLSASN